MYSPFDTQSVSDFYWIWGFLPQYWYSICSELISILNFPQYKIIIQSVQFTKNLFLRKATRNIEVCEVNIVALLGLSIRTVDENNSEEIILQM